MTYRIVVAIREHVAAEEAMAGGSEAVRVDEAADRGIVITALQVIESRLSRIGASGNSITCE